MSCFDLQSRPCVCSGRCAERKQVKEASTEEKPDSINTARSGSGRRPKAGSTYPRYSKVSCALFDMIGISYRREDTAPITGRIYDRLQALFGRDRVFMDLDSIPFGVDFRTHISEALNRCDTLLVVIGPHWLGVSADGSRRIDDATDFVRLEVAQALSRDIRVIPLLIDRTEMPSSTVLPDDLKKLAFRNALRVDSGADFHHHINRLCSSLQPAGSSSGPPAGSDQPVTTTASPSAPGNQVPPSSTVESLAELVELRQHQARMFGNKVGVLILALVMGSCAILNNIGSKNVWPFVIGGIMIVVPIVCFVFFVRLPPHLKRRK
jgi:hypothetical protein